MIPLKIQERVSKANVELANWTNGQAIDISANVGTSGILRAAQGDMCTYLFSSINWQAEGVSMDNISKVKASRSTLVMFENQTKGSGFFVIPASWDSMNVISAFIRWREYGNQSWDYPDSDLDAFLVTSWSSRIKDNIVSAISDENGGKTKYIEAAIAAEMYRMILYGEFRERSLKNLTVRYLYDVKPKKTDKTNHTKEWNSLVSLLSTKGADVTNRETVRQYFNIPQGGGGSIIVLDEPNLMRSFRKVKTNKLSVPEEDLQSNDVVKLRRDAFTYLGSIVERIDNVAKAEITNALTILQPIYDYFDSDDIDEDDIIDFAAEAKKFYDEINNAMIPVAFLSSDHLKKNAKQIAKAIGDISEVLDEDDPLTVLMTFSGDPISDIQPLLAYFKQLEADIEKVDKQLNNRKSALGNVGEMDNSSSRYAEEIRDIQYCITLMKGGQL